MDGARKLYIYLLICVNANTATIVSLKWYEKNYIEPVTSFIFELNRRSVVFFLKLKFESSSYAKVVNQRKWQILAKSERNI